MSAHTQAKATRLLAEGRVRPDIAIQPSVFHVEGDTSRYVTVVGAHVRMCSCEHWRARMTDCSHIEAAVTFVNATDEERTLIDQCIRNRREVERAAGEAAFASLDHA